MVTTIRHYVRTSEKLASMKQHVHFNIRAKIYNIILKSLKVKLLVNNQEGRDMNELTFFTSQDFSKYKEYKEFRT